MKNQIIKNWVPKPTQPVKVLIIAENCPDETKYLYRTLSHNITSKGPNNILNNVAKTFEINADSEFEKLNTFLKRRYFLIDSYLDGTTWDKTTKHHDIEELHNLILTLQPEQIVFTCKRSNRKILKLLINYEKNLINSNLKIVTNNTIKDEFNLPFVFSSISNRAYPLFDKEIKAAIKNNKLKF